MYEGSARDKNRIHQGAIFLFIAAKPRLEVYCASRG